MATAAVTQYEKQTVVGGGGSGEGTGLAGSDQPPCRQPAHGVSQRLAQLTALNGKLRRLAESSTTTPAGMLSGNVACSALTGSWRGGDRGGPRRPVSSPSNAATSATSTAGPPSRWTRAPARAQHRRVQGAHVAHVDEAQPAPQDRQPPAQ